MFDVFRLPALFFHLNTKRYSMSRHQNSAKIPGNLHFFLIIEIPTVILCIPRRKKNPHQI